MNEEIITETSTEVEILPETDTELSDIPSDTEVSTIEAIEDPTEEPTEEATEFESFEASTEVAPVVYSFDNASGDVYYPIIIVLLIAILGFMLISRFER